MQEDKNLVRRKSTGGRIFPGGGDEQILGWWGDSPSRENLIIPYRKAKNFQSFTLRRKTIFTTLKI